MDSIWWRRAILSASSSLNSTNWPVLTLSTTFRGNSSAAGNITRAEVAAGGGICGRGELVVDGFVVPALATTNWCWLKVVVDAATWALVSDTEVKRLGGGRVPKGAGGIRGVAVVLTCGLRGNASM